jgi:hypothetical protein
MTREQEMQLKIAAATARCAVAFGPQRFDQMANGVTQKLPPEKVEQLQADWANHPEPERFLEEKFTGKARAARSGLLDPEDWTAANIEQLDDAGFDKNLAHRMSKRRGRNGRP